MNKRLITFFLIMTISHQIQCMHSLTEYLKKTLSNVLIPARTHIQKGLKAAIKREKELLPSRCEALRFMCTLENTPTILDELFTDKNAKNYFKQWFSRTVDHISPQDRCQLDLHPQKKTIYNRTLTKDRFHIYLLRLTQKLDMEPEFQKFVQIMPHNLESTKPDWNKLKRELMQTNNPFYRMTLQKNIKPDIDRQERINFLREQETPFRITLANLTVNLDTFAATTFLKAHASNPSKK